MKNKRKIPAVFLTLVLITSALLLNIKVYTRQGIDYKVSFIKIPLYLKVLDFFNRHYNYKALAGRIIDGSTDDEEKVLKIFSWSYKHIKPQPEELPVVDDHVWHIIIRGYGAGEQSSDVFTTLCNYAGFEAFYTLVYRNGQEDRIPLSFVRSKSRWLLFDAYRGAYFKNKHGLIASIDDIKRDGYSIETVSGGTSPGFNYNEYFRSLQDIKEAGFRRANIQSPLRRFIFQVRRWLKIN